MVLCMTVSLGMRLLAIEQCAIVEYDYLAVIGLLLFVLSLPYVFM